MTDIVERLRVPCLERGLDEGWIDAQRREAADEITRLRAALENIIILSDDYHKAVPIARAALAEEKKG